jgi:hypothetical protein
MESAALLGDSQAAWEKPIQPPPEVPKLSVLERPELIDEAALPAEAVIPTPAVVRGRFIISKIGPPLVFALTIAAIIWFWPPF